MRAPVLAVGDGALGFWKALREVFPETREQRCWVHKTANVMDALPKSAQPAAKKALQDVYNAEDRASAEKAVKAFAKLYKAKFPKAVAKVVDDQDELLAFYDFPAEHWIHLRTTNPIESTFSTVRLRTKVTRGAGSRAAGLAMVFKLVESAQARWRTVNGAHLVPLVRAGARFERGLLVEREELVQAATPGPWFVRFLDDDHAMNLVAVSTVSDTGASERWPGFDCQEIVAATLVQQPRYVDMADERWDDNGRFIAAARESVPRLIDEIRRLRHQLDAALRSTPEQQ